MPAEIMIAITAQRQEQCQSQQREGHQSSSLLGKSVHFHFCSPFQGVVEEQRGATYRLLPKVPQLVSVLLAPYTYIERQLVGTGDASALWS